MASIATIVVDEAEVARFEESRRKFDAEKQNPRTNRNAIPTYKTLEGRVFIGFGKAMPRQAA
jgi:hypothetical protein